MHDSRHRLEYHTAARPREEFQLNLGRAVALGYVGLCVLALIVMGVMRAMEV